MKKIIAMTAAGLLSQLAVANEISLAISDEMLDLRLESAYEQGFFGRFAYMHADSDHVDSDQLSYTFGTVGKVDQFDVLLGLRPFWLDAESETGYGIALGVGAQVEVADKLTIGGELFYAPEVLTGGDIDDQLDMEVRVGYQIIENGKIFGGYREVEVDTDAGDFDLYDSFFVGMSLTF